MSTFTYDNAQNRETATVLGVSEDPTPNALNQPNTFQGAAVSHDLDGNMTGDGTWNYTYDADEARQREDGHAARRARRAKRRGCPRSGRDARQNRLKSCSKTGLTITYAYDFMGRRVEMKSNFGTWFFSKRFIWDGWNLIGDIWGDYSGTTLSGASFVLSSTYVWGIDVSGSVGGAGGVGGLALMYYNGRAFIPLQDGRGNIHGYLDTTTGKNAVSWDFTAYGETIHDRGGLSGQYGTHDFLFRYQSKMQDMEGHLLYFGHRFYHPGMGRFPNRDPIGEAGGLNLYGYVRNNPGNRWDYLGLNEDEPGSPNNPIVLGPFNVPGTRDNPTDTDRPQYITLNWNAGAFGRMFGWSFAGDSGWDDGTNGNSQVEITDPDADLQARKKRCADLTAMWSHLTQIHHRVGASLERTLAELGVSRESGLFKTVSDRIVFSATAGSAVTGFGSLYGLGSASLGFSAFAAGIDFQRALDAHASGDFYLRNQRLASAGIGASTATLALVSRGAWWTGWVGLGAAAVATGVGIYETYSLDRILMEDFEDLKMHTAQQQKTFRGAEERLANTQREYLKLKCNELGF